MTRERLFVFTRYPQPGTTKTRLIPAVGAESAASLQHALTAHVLSAARDLAEARKTGVEVQFDGGDEARVRETFGAEFDYRPQGSGDLGERMYRCLRAGLESGAESVMILGSDVPGIDAAILSEAFEALHGHDLVIGPAADGGYYLIGMRCDAPELFQNMPWGTGHVLRRTLDAAAKRGNSVHQLRPLEDVDRPEDLPMLEHCWGKDRFERALGRISVIVPTLNEAACIESTLAPLCNMTEATEVIVVDAGSTDGTPGKATALGATVLTDRRGRARQMNTGAARATGSILLFLHADTRLPGAFQQHVRNALRRPGVVGGAFEFRLDSDAVGYRLLERLTNWRARKLRMPYGDQALFMTAETYGALGGFPDLPIMEDFEMVRRLKRRGRLVIVPAPAVTSARRWRERGILKTTFINQAMIAGYCLGVSPRTLSRWYRSGEPGTNAATSR